MNLVESNTDPETEIDETVESEDTTDTVIQEDDAGDESPDTDEDNEDASAPPQEDDENEQDSVEDIEQGTLDTEDEVELPLEGAVEAVLFSARTPMTIPQIARCVGRGTKREKVTEAIASLNAHYSETGRAFEIVEVAEKWQLMSRPEYTSCLQRLHGKKKEDRKLSAAALDTLSIIAYKQPITRVEVEAIRGVGCGPVLRSLIERGSVKVVGKKMDVVGQPLLYGTTESFLQEFGLGSLEELPFVHELRQATGTDAALPEGGENSDLEFTIVNTGADENGAGDEDNDIDEDNIHDDDDDEEDFEEFDDEEDDEDEEYDDEDEEEDDD